MAYRRPSVGRTNNQLSQESLLDTINYYFAVFYDAEQKDKFGSVMENYRSTQPSNDKRRLSLCLYFMKSL